jgi:hypothetical protein
MQTSMLFSQFLNQAPLLLVYIGGIVLAAVWARRAPLAAILTLIGLAIMLVATLGFALFQNYVIVNRNNSAMTIGQMLQWAGLASSVLRAIGLGMVVAGVFVNRPTEARISGFDVRSDYRSGPPPVQR